MLLLRIDCDTLDNLFDALLNLNTSIRKIAFHFNVFHVKGDACKNIFKDQLYNYLSSHIDFSALLLSQVSSLGGMIRIVNSQLSDLIERQVGHLDVHFALLG